MALTSCPDRDQLLGYLLGRLPEDASEQIAAHLDECPACEAVAETLDQASDTLVSELRRPLLPGRFDNEPQYQQAFQRVLALASPESATSSGDDRTVGAMSPDLGQLGEYQLLEKLGEGGMGAVYKARHLKLDKLVALKILPHDRLQNPTALARFEREMKAVGRLNHLHIVQAHDAREIDGTHFLAMEYVEGLDLAKLISATGPLRVADACGLASQAAAGLDYAHRQGLVHRDVKPTNLMVDRQGQVKILDLGLALLASDRRADEEITVAGQVMGTADYMAPEQVSDSHNVDARADIYSLGCALYALLAGRPPFHAAGDKCVVTKMMAHLYEDPTPIGEVRPDVPAGLAAVLGRMMAKRPEDRLATADDVRAALSPFCPGADLPGLLARASAPSVAQLAGPAAQPEPLPHTHTRAVVPAAKPAEKQRKLRPTAALVATASLFAAVLLGIIIKIRTKDGQDITIHVPAGSTVTIQDDGKPEVTIPAQGERKTAAAQVPSKPSTPTIAPQPVEIKPGASDERHGVGGAAGSDCGPAVRGPSTRGHRGGVNSVAYSPDGRFLASAGREGTVRIWEAAGLKLLRILYGHDSQVNGVVWSPDGRYLASASCRRHHADLGGAAGRLLRKLRGHEGMVCAVAWSPDGTQIASGGDDKTLRFWDVGLGRASDGPQGECPRMGDRMVRRRQIRRRADRGEG